MGVAIGVDSHKSSLAAAALDELGRGVDVREFPNDAGGHDALLRWSRAQGRARVIGIEGTGNYGARLARHLLEAGESVYEVPAFLTHRERKRNPSKGSPILRTRSPSRASRLEVKAFHLPSAPRCSLASSCSQTTVTNSFAPAPG